MSDYLICSHPHGCLQAYSILSTHILFCVWRVFFVGYETLQFMSGVYA
jgi:hypothetical protein